MTDLWTKRFLGDLGENIIFPKFVFVMIGCQNEFGKYGQRRQLNVQSTQLVDEMFRVGYISITIYKSHTFTASN